MTARPSPVETPHPAPGRPLRVLVLTSMYPTPNRPSLGLFVKQEVDTIREHFPEIELDVLHVNGPDDRRNYVRAIGQLQGRLRRRTYDLVHAHYGLTGLVARCQARLPVVVSFRGSDVKFVRWQATLSKALVRVIDHTIVVAEWMAGELGAKSADVIPGGIDVDMFQPMDRAAARRRTGLEEGERAVLFPGARGMAVKNVSLFDAALDRLEERGMKVRRMYLDGVSRPHVPDLLSAVDVLLMTSITEGSPNSVKEACACNLPVVSVDVGDVRQYLIGARNCHVTSREPDEIAARVADVLESGGRSDARGNILHLDRYRMAERVAAVYRKVVSS